MSIFKLLLSQLKTTKAIEAFTSGQHMQNYMARLTTTGEPRAGRFDMPTRPRGIIVEIS